MLLRCYCVEFNLLKEQPSLISHAQLKMNAVALFTTIQPTELIRLLLSLFLLCRPVLNIDHIDTVFLLVLLIARN